jgi:hypothetical protein
MTISSPSAGTVPTRMAAATQTPFHPVPVRRADVAVATTAMRTRNRAVRPRCVRTNVITALTAASCSTARTAALMNGVGVVRPVNQAMAPAAAVKNTQTISNRTQSVARTMRGYASSRPCWAVRDPRLAARRCQ